MSTAASAERAVETERRGPVLVVTLQRPHVRNAVNEALANQLAEAMDLLDDDPDLVAGVITGAPPGFSSGMDLKAFLAGERAWHPVRGFAGITRRPSVKPLVAAIEGFAVAGGLEIALSCDILVAARDVRFGIAEVKRSLVATGGALLRLPQRAPLNAVLQLALTGDLIDAGEAYRLGFVNVLCAPGAALDEALTLASRIAENGPLAVIATKRILTQIAAPSPDEAWTAQDEVARPVLESEDAREGAAAFAAKRQPRWRGR